MRICDLSLDVCSSDLQRLDLLSLNVRRLAIGAVLRMFGIICEEVGNIGRFLPVGEFGIDNAAEKFTELLHPLVEIEFAVDEVNLRHFRISISESARPILMAKRACLLSASGSSFGSVPCRP